VANRVLKHHPESEPETPVPWWQPWAGLGLVLFFLAATAAVVGLWVGFLAGVAYQTFRLITGV
jgi:hypothetical protein